MFDVHPLLTMPLFTGNHYSKVADLFRFVNMGVTNASTFRQLQLLVVRPVTLQKRDTVLARNCEDSRMKAPNGLVVAGNIQVIHNPNRICF